MHIIHNVYNMCVCCVLCVCVSIYGKSLSSGKWDLVYRAEVSIRKGKNECEIKIIHQT